MNNLATRTTDLYLNEVLNSAKCAPHKVPKGTPCFHIPKMNGIGYYGAVCNKRALAAGFNGKISPASLAFGRTPRRPVK